MCDHVLSSPNLSLHCLETRLLPCRRRQGLLPLPVSFTAREPPHNPLLHLVLEPPQGPSHAGGDHPGLLAEEQHRLQHGFKKNPDTRGSAPSLLSIIVVLFHTALAQDKLLTTTGQLLSASDITCHRYRREFILYRGRP